MVAAGACALAQGPVARAQAQDPAPAEVQHDPKAATKGPVLQEVKIVGLRYRVRSLLDTPSPVDIVGPSQMVNQPTSDVTDILRNEIPSFSTNDNAITGTGTTVRPAELRGLPPDQTLVLIDGKRWHRSADITVFSGPLSDNTEPVDLGSLPASAFKQVQVLRDGASAMYGSDAMAGVINFVPSDELGGFISAKGGQAFDGGANSNGAGNGANWEFDAAYGVPLGLDKSGFARLTVEYSGASPTNRSSPTDNAALRAMGFTDVPDSPRLGTPGIHRNVKVFLNSEMPINDQTKLYAFGSYSQRREYDDFFFRDPTATDGIFTFTDAAGHEAFLVGDLTPGQGSTCPSSPSNPIEVSTPGSLQALQTSLAAAGSHCFSFLSMYPGGYVPRFRTQLTDLGGYIGVRGSLQNGLQYDVSFGSGRNYINFAGTTGVNASLGPATPTSFSTVGARTQQENTGNIDVTYPLNVPGLASPLHLATGIQEYHQEWSCTPGEASTFANNPVLAAQGFLPGVDFAGPCTPDIAGTFDSDNFSAYVDMGADVTSRLNLDVAARGEKFSDTGGVVTYKVAGIYHITSSFAVRATYGEGFHDPSPGQRHFEAVNESFTSTGVRLLTGTVSPTDPEAALVGAKPLVPEVSHSLSVGFVVDARLVKATLDLYSINEAHRLTISQNFALTPAQQAALVAEGNVQAAQFTLFNYPVNALSTRTLGGDLRAVAPLNFIPWGRTTTNLTLNYNHTHVRDQALAQANGLSADNITILQDELPKWRGSLALEHVEARWYATLRANYWGSAIDCLFYSCSLATNEAARVTLDLVGGYIVTDRLHLLVGLENFTDRYPTKEKYPAVAGNTYPLTNIFGNNGGEWYLQLKYDF
jgi:iron complex outermembrane recepter protein